MRITDAGVFADDLSTWKTRLEEIFRSALGQDLNVEPETPQGQLIGILSLAMAQADEVAVAISNGRSVSRSTGRQQDDIGSLLSIQRRDGSKSRVTATISGVAGSAIPVGMIARTDPGGDDFETIASAVIPAGGSVDVIMESRETGAVQANAGALSLLVSLPAGVESITNTSSASVGLPRETDAEFRARYAEVIGRHGAGYREAIRSAIVEKPGVIDAEVFDNNTGASVNRKSVAIPAHSILAVVDGGQASDIASALAESKPLGVGMAGTTTHDIDGTTYRWYAVQEISLVITLQVRVRAGFPSDGIGTIRQNILDWADGEFNPGTAGFDTTGLSIGESISTERLRTPINAVPGHDIVSLSVQQMNSQGTAVALTTPTLIQRQTIDADDINVSIVS